METDAPKACSLQGPVVAAAKGERIQVLAHLRAEDEIVVAREVVALLELAKHIDQLGHHRHASDALALRDLLAAVRVIAPDVDQAADEINLLPAQRQQLALT